MNAVRDLLRGLIDDAGTFPPESLTLDAAVQRNIDAQDGPEAWMLGRFVVPSSNATKLSGTAPFVWRLSVVLDQSSVTEALSSARAAHDSADAVVESTEVPIARGKGADSAYRISDLATQLVGAGLGEVELFVEVPLGARDDITAIVSELARAQREHGLALFAKVRCGGATVPAPSALAVFLVDAHREALAFKATAGLHDPIAHRAENGVFAHGFLNIAFGCALLTAGAIDEARLADLLADEDPAHFTLEAGELRWNGHVANADAIAASRRNLFRSFGSCSLSEPIDGLLRLGFVEHEVS